MVEGNIPSPAKQEWRASVGVACAPSKLLSMQFVGVGEEEDSGICHKQPSLPAELTGVVGIRALPDTPCNLESLPG